MTRACKHWGTRIQDFEYDIPYREGQAEASGKEHHAGRGKGHSVQSAV